MNELETQVAKIQIGSPKQANTYVFCTAERIEQTDAELYVIIELPVFNPAAVDDCEHIAQAIAASLRRSYKKPVLDNSFELSLSQINEELGKLSSLGKTSWIGKMNALIGVKHGSNLSIAATGKITALLLRDNQFMTVADSTTPTHALKTFENFAVGKLKIDDLLILSTNQLFNNISIDRLKNILLDYTLPLAAQEVIRILEDNAGPEVAFGTLIAQMAEPGTVTPGTEELIVEDVTARTAVLTSSLPDKLRAFRQNIWKKAGHGMENMPRPRQILNQRGKVLEMMGQGFYGAKNKLSLENFQQFSKQKKFLFISAGLLLIILVLNLTLTHRYKNTKTQSGTVATTLAALAKDVTDATASYLYHDESKTLSLLSDFDQKSQNIGQLSTAQKRQLDDLQRQVVDLKGKIEHTTKVNPTTIATLSSSDRLINLPTYIATQTNGALISYDKTNNKTEDGKLRASKTIAASAYLKNSSAVVYTGAALAVWNFDTGLFSPEFSQNVPATSAFGGLALYSTNGRVYVLDKSAGKVISFLADEKAGFSKPIVSVANQNFSTAVDLAVDGNIYILVPSGIKKFQSGKPVDLPFPNLLTPFSGRGRIYTQKDFNFIYILDSGNNRILILDKSGNLSRILTSDQFTKLKDFAVDEKNKILLLLNDTTLLKVGL